MKIAQINTSYLDFDSTGRSTRELHQFFLGKGIDSRVYINKIERLDEENVYVFSNWIDCKVHSFMSHLTGLQGYYSYLSTKKLIRNLEADRPNVIILRVLHSNNINFKELFAYIAKNNIPVIFVLHDCFYITGHCCYYTDVNCGKWQENCGECPSMKKWNKSWFFDTSRKALNDKKNWYNKLPYKGVIAVSHWVEEDVKKSILSDAATTTVYNWIDNRVFFPRETFPSEIAQLRGEKLALAVCSGWNVAKGAQEIMLVAEAIQDLQIIVVGKPCEEFKSYDNIHLLGTIKDVDKLAELYSAVDVFLNPSHMETFGKTTAEALSCGTPAVVFDTTACRELVNQDRGGVATYGDIEDFVAKVRNVLQKGKNYYKDAALAFAKANFDPLTNMNKYLEFIESYCQKL